MTTPLQFKKMLDDKNKIDSEMSANNENLPKDNVSREMSDKLQSKRDEVF